MDTPLICRDPTCSIKGKHDLTDACDQMKDATVIEKPTLAADLEKMLNSHSAENASGTPNFILAEFMMHCLRSFNAAVCAREAWHGRDAYGLSALRALKDEAAPKPVSKFVGSHDVQDGE